MARPNGQPSNPDLGKRHCFSSCHARSRKNARFATALARRPILNGGIGMRSITEFKGYRTIIAYDAETGTFVSQSIPEDRMEMKIDEALQAWAEVLPFPEAESEKINLKPRKAG